MIFLIALSIITLILQPISNYNFPNKSIDQEVIPYFSDFYNQVAPKLPNERKNKLDLLKITVINKNLENNFFNDHFSDRANIIQNNMLAFCDFKENTIYIREISLKKESKESIQGSIDHEIGHCVFGRTHSFSRIIVNGEKTPTTIMGTTISKNYNEMKQIYRNEMINSSKNDRIIQLYQKELELRTKKLDSAEIIKQLKLFEIQLDKN